MTIVNNQSSFHRIFCNQFYHIVKCRCCYSIQDSIHKLMHQRNSHYCNLKDSEGRHKQAQSNQLNNCKYLEGSQLHEHSQVKKRLRHIQLLRNHKNNDKHQVPNTDHKHIFYRRLHYKFFLSSPYRICKCLVLHTLHLHMEECTQELYSQALSIHNYTDSITLYKP